MCCALLTLLLREDHFSNGLFDTYQRKGQVKPIVKRMISLLEAKNSPNMKFFSEKAIEALNGFYVYALVDPKTIKSFISEKVLAIECSRMRLKAENPVNQKRKNCSISFTPQILHRIVKEKSPEHPHSTEKFTHVVSDYGLTCGQTQKKWVCSTPKAGKNKPILYIAKTRDFKRFCEINKEKSGILRLPIFGRNVHNNIDLFFMPIVFTVFVSKIVRIFSRIR